LSDGGLFTRGQFQRASDADPLPGQLPSRGAIEIKGPVLKKWLSYRERDLLGRALTPAEAREVRDTARRIAALILLQPELDANYAAVKANLYDWRAATRSAE